MWSVGLNEAVERDRAVGVVIMRAYMCVNASAVCMRVVNERKERKKGRKGGWKGRRGLSGGGEKKEDKKTHTSEEPPAKIQSGR